jgi:prevent-host-death family protein
MQTVSPEHAAEHLDALIERARAGEEVVIVRGGVPVARLVPIGDPGERYDEADAASEGNSDAPSEEVDEAFHGD